MNNEEKILEMLKNLTEKVDGIDKRVDSIDKRVDSIDRRVDSIDKRVDQLDERSQRTAVLLETEVNRKLQLLYEGHEAIMEALDGLASKSRVEALEDDVSLLKSVVKSMSQRLAELEKAQ